jgi:hypothetical protein
LQRRPAALAALGPDGRQTFPVQHAQAAFSGAAARLQDQPCLAHPALAADQEDASASGHLQAPDPSLDLAQGIAASGESGPIQVSPWLRSSGFEAVFGSAVGQARRNVRSVPEPVARILGKETQQKLDERPRQIRRTL